VPDFAQTGPITTLHDLGAIDLDAMEATLDAATTDHPLGLVLPVTAEDARAAPFARIVEQLQGAGYVEEIVVALGRAPDVDDYRHVRALVEPLGSRAQVLWTDGARFHEQMEVLQASGIGVPAQGKGASVWAAFGYLLGNPRLQTFVLHDCDIVNYDRNVLARLCLPMAHPSLDFEYCKAYYARRTTRLYGRMTRLLVSPLLEALDGVFPQNRFLRYMRGFRYPLSGEFAVAATLAATNRIPPHWGLEVGTLAEVWRNTSVKRVCQVDLGVPYEHKHQEVSADDASQGLMRMAKEIILTMLRTLSSMGTTLAGEETMLRSLYLRLAQDAIRQYHADAMFNGLDYDRNEEEHMVEAVGRQIHAAGEEFERDPEGGQAIPNWKRVRAAHPDFPQKLRDVTAEEARHAG
jgi:glucosyl-3-phosphoglycerate synthase